MSLRFKQLRKEHLTKAELAEKLSVDVRTITNWEKENGTVPSLDLCKELGQMFGVSSYEIYQCFMEHPDDPDLVVEETSNCLPDFIPFMQNEYKTKDRGYHGFLQYGKAVFCFGGIYMLGAVQKDWSGFITMDSNYNMVCFLHKDIRNIVPIAYAYGNYSCMIETVRPVFPEMIPEIDQSGSAKVQLTLFSC